MKQIKETLTPNLIETWVHSPIHLPTLVNDYIELRLSKLEAISVYN